MTKNSLQRKTIHGVIWNGLSNFTNLGISFIVGIVMARLLTPDDYGLIGMIAVFMGISYLFSNCGFGSALIRKSDMNDEDVSTAFFFNIIVASICYIILFFSAPAIAKFYDKPILIEIVRIQSLTIIIGAFGMVQGTLYRKRLDFKTPMKIGVISNVVSSIFGLVFAFKGFGVWSLVCLNIASSIVGTVLNWLYSPWRPQLVFSRSSIHYLFGYGSKLTASGLLDAIYSNIYPIVIGKFFSPASLGFYTKAQSFAKLPSQNVTNVIQAVTFPVLSTIQDDNQRLSDDYRRLLKMSAYIIFPLMIGLAAVASPFIRVLITDKWAQSIIYLQIICFSLMWYPIHAINLNLLQVKGRSDLFLRLEIIKKIVGVSIMFFTIPMGLIAMCVGNVITSVLCLFINTYYTGKLINVGYLRQMYDLLPILIMSLIMGTCVYFAITLFENQLLKLVVGIVVGIVVYFMLSFITSNSQLKELINIVKNRKWQ